MKVWINGALVDRSRALLSVFDHGLTVGDGVFETVKAVAGQPFALTRHLDRLRRSATGLGLPAPDLDAIRVGVRLVLDAGAAPRLARIRITYTGGAAPLGSERGKAGPSVIVATEPMDPPSPVTDVVVVPWRRNEQGALTGLKTTSYAENVRALSYAHRRSASEAIFANTAGDLCEGTGSNVFVVIEGRLMTPPLSAGCLAGVTRALVLEWVGGVETALPLDALTRAEEAFLTSTGRDVQAIRAVDGHALTAAPGPVTRQAMEVFARKSASEPDP